MLQEDLTYFPFNKTGFALSCNACNNFFMRSFLSIGASIKIDHATSTCYLKDRTGECERNIGPNENRDKQGYYMLQPPRRRHIAKLCRKPKQCLETRLVMEIHGGDEFNMADSAAVILGVSRILINLSSDFCESCLSVNMAAASGNTVISIEEQI
jgi:hypothetical protein